MQKDFQSAVQYNNSIIYWDVTDVLPSFLWSVFTLNEAFVVCVVAFCEALSCILGYSIYHVKMIYCRINELENNHQLPYIMLPLNTKDFTCCTYSTYSTAVTVSHELQGQWFDTQFVLEQQTSPT